jgi:hypothetical protein
VEERFFLRIGGQTIRGKPEEDIERTREDGKTSSVHFLRFGFTDAQARAFRDAAVEVMIGCDHPNYGHLAVIAQASRAELDKDLD